MEGSHSLRIGFRPDSPGYGSPWAREANQLHARHFVSGPHSFHRLARKSQLSGHPTTSEEQRQEEVFCPPSTPPFVAFILGRIIISSDPCSSSLSQIRGTSQPLDLTAFVRYMFNVNSRQRFLEHFMELLEQWMNTMDWLEIRRHECE